MILQICEKLYGLLLILVGLNGMVFKKGKPVLSPEAQAVYDGFTRARFLFPVVYSSLIVAGGLLVVHTAIPFALILASPTILTIYLFNVFLQRNYICPGLFFCLFNVALASQYWDVYRALFFV